MMLPRHIWPDTATISDGRLYLGGCDARALAAAYGTPLYVFDEATLRGAMRAYLAAFRRQDAPFGVHYAAKALLNTALAQIVTQEGLGLDVVSGAELLVARRAGVPMERVHFHGNAPGDAELERAVAWGVGAVVVDNLDELERLAALTAGRERPQGVMLRVAPGIEARTHPSIATGGADSKFGLPPAALDAAATRLRAARPKSCVSSSKPQSLGLKPSVSASGDLMRSLKLGFGGEFLSSPGLRTKLKTKN